MQKRTQNKLYNGKIATLLFTAVLVFFSVVLLSVSYLAISGEISSYMQAKDMKNAWNTYLSSASAPANENGDGIVTTSDHEIISLNDLYSSLFPPNSANMAAGIITEGKDAGGNTTPARLRKITQGADAGRYNYCITISTAYELMAFSTLSAGYHPGIINIGKDDETLSKFFRSANYVLGNNINYKGNSKYTIKNGAAVSEKYIGIPLVNYTSSGTLVSYTSNGSYFGYGEMYEGSVLVSSNVIYPFIPVQNFSGVFDGKNFNVSNLSILRNNKIQTSADYDAFFASVLSGGIVRNFGLTAVSFVKTSLSSDDVSTFRPVAGIVGINGGTVRYVYNTNATFYSNQSAYRTIGENVGEGSVSSFYSGDAALLGADGSPLTGGDGNRLYLESNEGKGISFTNGDARWYSSDGSSRFENAAHDIYAAHYSARGDYSYRLNGLKVNASAPADTQSFTVYSPADFLTFTHVAKEGFTRLSGNTADSTAAKGSVAVEIANDLNFTHVGKTSVVPIVDLSASPYELTLYSNNSSSVVDFGSRQSLYNLTLNAYLDYGKSIRMYGIFTTNLDATIAPPLSVYNLNLIDNSIKIADEVIMKVGDTVYPSMSEIVGKNTAAGLIVGATMRPVDIAGVATNGTIRATNGDYTAGPNGIGGMVGWIHKIGNVSVNYKSRFTSVVFSGELDSAARITNGLNNAWENNRYGTGGIVGFIHSDTADAATQKNNIFFNNVYVGGNIYGLGAIDRLTGNSGPISGVGGLVGVGNLCGTAFNALSSIYIDAGIHSFKDSYVVGQPYFAAKSINGLSANIGGLIGEWNQKGSNIMSVDLGCSYDRSCTEDHSKIRIDSTISLNFAIGTPESPASIFLHAGGITGLASGVNVSNLNVTHVFGGTLNVGGFDARRNNTGTVKLNTGNLFGTVNNINFRNINNDKSIDISAKFNNLTLGGIAGSDSANSAKNTFTNVRNVAPITVIPYTTKNATTPNASVLVSGLFSSSYANSTVTLDNCFNSGAISVLTPEGSDNSDGYLTLDGQVAINGLVNLCQTSFGDVITNSGNSGNITAKIFHTRNNAAINYTVNGIAQAGALANCTNSGELYMENFATTQSDMSLSGLVYNGEAYNCENTAAGKLTLIRNGRFDTAIAGIGRNLNTVKYSVNRAEIKLENIATTNNANIFASGIAVTAANLQENENYGNIVLNNISTVNLFVGGISAVSADSNMILDGGISFVGNTNYGAVSLTACTAAINVGGVAGALSTSEKKLAFKDNYNFGNLDVNCPSLNSPVYVGGIVGSTTNFLGFDGCINKADITVTTNVSLGGVGGIFGMRSYTSVIGSGPAGLLTDCFNLGNITVNGGANASKSIGVGGIGGRIDYLYNPLVDSGTPTLANAVNSGNVTLNVTAGGNNSQNGTGAGGIVGSLRDALGAARYLNMQSVLNYGSISLLGSTKTSGWGAGGIIGVASDSVRLNIKGAVNYGTVNSANASGGILGACDSTTVGISIAEAANYGKLIGAKSFGLLGANDAAQTAVTVKMGIFADPDYGNTALYPTNSVTVTDGHAYLANSSAAGAISLSQLYAQDFALFPGANEIAYYGKKDTDFSTLVWSEFPYMYGGSYHTPTAASSGKIYAVTTTAGRRAGIYAGENYNASTIGAYVKNSARASELLNALPALKQIGRSRDTYVNYYETRGGVETLREFILRDGDSSKAYQDLPALSFNGTEDKFYTVILNDSPYYVENLKANSFSFNGSDVRLKNYSAFHTADGRLPMFSAGAKLYTGAGYNSIAGMSGFKVVSYKTLNFKSNGVVNDLVTPVTAVTLEAIIYQGDWNGSDQQWLAKYATTYKFEVIFYKATPSFVMDLLGDYGDNWNFYIVQKANIFDAAESSTLLYADPSQSNAAEVVYDFKSASDNSDVTVNWAYSRFSANFTLSAVDIDAFSTNIKTNFYVKQNGIYTLLNYPNNQYYSYSHFTSPLEPIYIPEANILVQRFRYTFYCALTDPNNFKELAGGDYRIELVLELADKTFKRVFQFEKEKSGDVFYHENTGTGDDAVNKMIAPSTSRTFQIPFIDISNVDSTKVNLVRYLDATALINRVNTVEKDAVSGKNKYTVGFEQVIARQFPVAGEYYGAILSPYFLNSFGVLGAFLPVSDQSRTLFTFSHLLPQSDSSRPLPTPAVEFRLSEDGTMASIILSFTVYAENGDFAEYRYVYKYDSVPQGNVSLYADDNTLYPSSKVNVAKTGSVNVSVSHNFPNMRFNVKDFMQVNYTDIFYALDSSLEKVKIGTITVAKNELGQFAYSLVKTADGETVAFPEFEVVANPDNVNGYRLKVKFNQETASGIFDFVPVVQYAYSCFSSASGKTPALPSYVTVKSHDGTVQNELRFAAYAPDAQKYSFEKQASRNAYLREMSFSTNIPSGGFFQYYNFDPNNGSYKLESIGGLTEVDNADRMVLHYTDGVSMDKFVNPDLTDIYLSPLRANSFRVLVTFPSAVMQGFSDYTSWISLKLSGENTPLAPDEFGKMRRYNDEYSEVYLLRQDDSGAWVESETPLQKTTVYKTDGEGNQVVDYQTVELYLPESSLVRVRVRAGNPLFYNDYEFLSDGPLRNKNFNIKIEAPQELDDMIFVVYLKAKVGDKTVRTLNFLFKTSATGTELEAVLNPDTGQYEKEYFSVYNITGVYELSLMSLVPGYVAELNVTGPPDLLDFTAGNNYFVTKTELAATYDVTVKIKGSAAIPPWGDQIFD